MDTFNQTEHELKYDDILDAFNDNLLKYPDGKIVSVNDESYTFSQAAYIAFEIAKSLKNAGVNSNDCVSFVCERSQYYIFNVLAILSIGAVPVPIDNVLPDERIKFMLKDSDSKVVITTNETHERVNNLSEDIVVLNVQDIDCEGNLSYLPVSYGHLAGILYTSGSTGVPKGVKITRKSVLNLSAHYCNAQNLTNDSVYALYASIGFDAGYKSVFKVLYSGACLVIVPEEIKFNMYELNDYFIRHNVEHVFITTQVSKLFMQSIKNTSLKVLSVGGEKLGDFESPDYVLMDDYGPTEAFAFITSIDNAEKIDDSSIGFLNCNSKAYILDSDGRRVPYGAVGELYLSGYQISDGYLNREEETIHAFLYNPFDENEDYGVLYRSGDMVHILSDGSIGFVGRRDSQVKIRGNRVELSEVESVIRDIDYVNDVTVQAVNNELAAYVVVDEEFKDTDIKDSICEYIGKSKPEYMIPSFVIKH